MLAQTRTLTTPGPIVCAVKLGYVYIIDLTHYLDEKGAIAPRIGPARKIANFLTAVVAHASDLERPEETPGPLCSKCRKRDQSAVATGINADWQIIWYCPTCGTEGQISNWEHTFWDMTEGRPAA